MYNFMYEFKSDQDLKATSNSQSVVASLIREVIEDAKISGYEDQQHQNQKLELLFLDAPELQKYCFYDQDNINTQFLKVWHLNGSILTSTQNQVQLDQLILEQLQELGVHIDFFERSQILEMFRVQGTKQSVFLNNFSYRGKLFELDNVILSINTQEILLMDIRIVLSHRDDIVGLETFMALFAKLQDGFDEKEKKIQTFKQRL